MKSTRWSEFFAIIEQILQMKQESLANAKKRTTDLLVENGFWREIGT